MKKTLFLTVTIGWTFITGQAQTLSGKVTDAATGKALAGASVFINLTSKGTATARDGTFQLPGLSQGRYDLIISSIGYGTTVLHLRADSLPPFLSVPLRPKAAGLDAYTVEAWLKDGWRQWGKFFMDNFIGVTPNASSCRLDNKEALRFHYSKKRRRLSVSATAPLIIHNKALGYDLQYQLEVFSYDERTDIIQFTGYPLFKEMSGGDERKRQEWQQRRKDAYLGSMHHFLQSLYAGCAAGQGFDMRQPVTKPNQEKERVKKVYDPNAAIGAYPRNSLYYYFKVLRQPDRLQEEVRIQEDSLVKDTSGGFRRLFFAGTLYIKYFEKASDEDAMHASRLLYTGGSPVELDRWGNYFPADAILTEGHWAQTEKVCNMVPLDYPMPSGPR